MKILAIDCSGIVASAAIVSDEKVICEFNVNNKLTHAENLMPMISKCFEFSETNKEDLDYIAVTSGPGSFTGLRIGAATAKSIAHGLDIKLIPVPTLDCLAYNIFNPDSIIIPIMDAKKNEVYAAIYENNGEIKRLSDYMADNIDVILRLTNNYKKRIIFLGDGVPVYKSRISEFNPNFLFAPINNNMQRAATVGMIASKNTENAVDYKDFAPSYIRIPQAELESRHYTGERV